MSWVVSSFNVVLLFLVLTSFVVFKLILDLTSFGDALIFWLVTSFDIVGGIVVRLTTIDPLLLQNLPENLHVLHDTVLVAGIFFFR